MARTWLITGAGRGFGLAIARAALEAGDQVIATARDLEQVGAALASDDGRLLVAQLDITDARAAVRVVEAGLERFSRIDVLVNNAGYGQAGAFEELSPALIERQFRTNVFGTFHVTRAVLPAMRAQRARRIITISSLLGVVGTDWWSVYCAAKFAVAGWSESLTRELAPFGIDVTVVHPGQFATDFLDPTSLGMVDVPIDDYRPLDDARRDFVADRNHAQPGDPSRFAAAIVELAAQDVPPARVAAGADALDAFAVRAGQLLDSARTWPAFVPVRDRATDRVAAGPRTADV